MSIGQYGADSHFGTTKIQLAFSAIIFLITAAAIFGGGTTQFIS